MIGVDKFKEKTTQDKYLYHEATLKDEKGVDFVVRLFVGSKMGGVATMERTKAILQEFSPALIMMTGVCGGRRGEVQLGDLLVADRVFALQGKQYADGREMLDTYVGELRDQLLGFVRQLARAVPSMTTHVTRGVSKEFQRDHLLAAINKSANGLTGAELKQAATAVGINNEVAYKALLDEVRLKHKWIEMNNETKRFVLTDAGRIRIAAFEDDGLTFPQPFPDKPQQHVGPILVSNTHVRGDMTKEKWDKIASFERKVLGVEMEGTAFFEAARIFNENRKDGRNTGVVFVKGVMDFADEDKDDGFKQYAAELSAEWAHQFIVKYAAMAIGANKK
jgi:nucleoside phosphorylase